MSDNPHGLTEAERFHFDLAGFLVRPAILTPDEVAEIRDQIDRIIHDPESLPSEHRRVPGGPASLLIDHPKVIGVLHDIIGPEVRLESVGCVWREKGQRHGELHSTRLRSPGHTLAPAPRSAGSFTISTERETGLLS